VSQRVDFSANASIYDRRHGTILALEAARELAQRGGLRPGCRVLEVGAGTGRVAIAFAGIGYETVAFDSALSMLNELRRKASESQIHIVAGEGARLPFAEGHFDAVILARVLYLMVDWQTVLRQTSDVLKPGGCLFHEWGNGQADEPWVQIREQARTLFQHAGVDQPFHPGARSEAEVGAFLAELGFDRRDEFKVGPGPVMTLRDFVGRIVSGEMSYIWHVPKQVQESCLPRLSKWCEGNFDMERSVAIPREFYWTIHRKRQPLSSANPVTPGPF
jgi:SAM-dependent methyltransferase